MSTSDPDIPPATPAMTEDEEGGGVSTSSGDVLPGVPIPGVPSVLSKLQKWGDYANYGEPVEPSRFIPMKTPLSPSLVQGDTTVENVLTLPCFLAEQQQRGRSVGLVIDLSNHDCLYADGVPASGLRRVQVRNVAKSVPSIACTSAVITIANEFWARNPHEYVAIHCAYGFNRTGFVLCCYLIEMCGLSADAALANFAAARNPGVKHERFKVALRCRYPTPGCAPVVESEEELARAAAVEAAQQHLGDHDTLELDVELKVQGDGAPMTMIQGGSGDGENATTVTCCSSVEVAVVVVAEAAEAAEAAAATLVKERGDDLAGAPQEGA